MILVEMRSPVVVHDFSLLYAVYVMLFPVFWRPVGFSTYIFGARSKTLIDSASLCRTSDHQTTSNNTYHMASLEMVQRSEETKGYSKAISSPFLRQCDIMWSGVSNMSDSEPTIRWHIFHVTGQVFTYLLWAQVTFKLSFSEGGRRKCNITFR